jgi:pantetheine-phosphate adenylyltransferase
MKVLYPGSFNPWHNGHQHVYDEACKIFGKENVYIGLAYNADKSTDVNEVYFRQWCMNSVSDNIVVIDGLIADYCREGEFDRIIRGVRQGYDLQLEEKLSHWNYEIGGVRTIYIPTPTDNMFVSSSFLREVKPYKDFEFLSQYMPTPICGRWKYNTSIPTATIYYGKSCVGKTTYLNKKYRPLSLSWDDNNSIIEGDQKIWEVLGWDDEKISEFKLRMTIAIMDEADIEYQRLLQQIVIEMEGCWDALFHYPFDDYDFPVIGNYFDYIPNQLKYQFNYVEFQCKLEERKERYRKRGGYGRSNWLEKLDKFYLSPPFKDEVIDLT